MNKEQMHDHAQTDRGHHAHHKDHSADSHDRRHARHDEGHDHHGHGDGDHTGHHAAMMQDFQRRFWVSLGLTVPILVLSPMIQGWLGLQQTLALPGDSYVQFALATLVFFYGGWPFLTGLTDEVKDRQPGMMTLIALAIVVAYGYSSLVVFGLTGRVFFWELATLIDVMLLGHWIEMRSVMGASGALQELVKLVPADAHRLTEGGDTEDVPVTRLEAGDRVLIKPGERVPVDGTILDGQTSIDESMLTGESVPVAKQQGDEVVGGSINSDGSITVEVEKTGEDTYLSQVVRMVREAQQSRSRQQDFANRVAGWLTYTAISVGLVTLAAWLLLGEQFVYAMERMVTVMVITCPHALGLAVPLVIAVSTTLAARHGLLIRQRASFERARLLDAVVFDKTGTLTEGRFGVTDVVPLDDRDEQEVLRLAAGLESHSEHPIGRAIVEEAKKRDIQLPQPEDFKNIPGKGAQAKVDGRQVKVVSPGYLKEEGLKVEDDRPRSLAQEGKTVVYLLADDKLAGAIALADIVREESREAVDALKRMGLRLVMITGDSETVADAVADELGLDEHFAEVLPEHKADKIAELQGRGLRVAMVGDGVNDAPALAKADLGVAIGAGTQVAIETADVVLVRSDPRDAVRILALSQATYRKMLQNLAWATGYNVLAIPLAAGVLAWTGIVLSPAVGALLMSASTVIVAINARFLSLGDQQQDQDDSEAE